MYDFPLIALGANLSSRAGAPARTLGAALAALAQAGFPALRISRFYASPCFPPGAGPDYVNAVVMLGAGRDPRAVLDALHQVEADFGRERTQRWGMRVLDLDLLALGAQVQPNAGEQARWRDLPLEVQMRDAPGELILPHPRLQDRAFVLVPLADIAPGWRHPATGQSVAQMVAALDPADVAALTPL